MAVPVGTIEGDAAETAVCRSLLPRYCRVLEERLAASLIFKYPRIAAVSGLAAAYLSLPLFVYLVFPRPFRQVVADVNGSSSLQLPWPVRTTPVYGAGRSRFQILAVGTDNAPLMTRAVSQHSDVHRRCACAPP